MSRHGAAQEHVLDAPPKQKGNALLDLFRSLRFPPGERRAAGQPVLRREIALANRPVDPAAAQNAHDCSDRRDPDLPGSQYRARCRIPPSLSSWRRPHRAVIEDTLSLCRRYTASVIPRAPPPPAGPARPLRGSGWRAPLRAAVITPAEPASASASHGVPNLAGWLSGSAPAVLRLILPFATLSGDKAERVNL